MGVKLVSCVIGRTQAEVLRLIFGPRRDEATEGWKKLQNEALHVLCSPNRHVVRVIISRGMR
jgi:hypothetical protein